MPMPGAYKDTLINMLGGGAPVTVYPALHIEDVPSAFNEVPLTAGYERQAVTLKESVGEAGLREIEHLTVPGTIPVCSFVVPSGTDVKSVAYWTSGTYGAGTILWYFNITDETFSNAGRAELNSGSIGLGDLSG
jgi:hypothetical protein